MNGTSFGGSELRVRTVAQVPVLLVSLTRAPSNGKEVAVTRFVGGSLNGERSCRHHRILPGAA